MEITGIDPKLEILTIRVAAMKIPGHLITLIEEAVKNDEIDYCYKRKKKFIIANSKWQEFFRRKTVDPNGWKGNADSVNYR